MFGRAWPVGYPAISRQEDDASGCRAGRRRIRVLGGQAARLPRNKYLRGWQLGLIV